MTGLKMKPQNRGPCTGACGTIKIPPCLTDSSTCCSPSVLLEILNLLGGCKYKLSCCKFCILTQPNNLLFMAKNI